MHKLKHIVIIFLLSLLMVSASAASANEFIIFSRLSADGYWQIWVMDTDGSNSRQVTTSDSDKRDPAWMGPERIAYRTSNGELFVSDLNTQSEREVLSKYKAIRNPDYSRVAEKIVFVRMSPQYMDVSNIWSADVEGKFARILTREKGIKYQPRFSPDGNTIAYVHSNQDRSGHNIWLMNSDGSNKQQLTTGTYRDTLPAFSPDQKNLLITSNRDGGSYDIYQLNRTSGRMQRLTDYQGLDTHARYSPNGQKIIFVSNRSGKKQLWMMDADGTNPQQLTNSPDESIDPAWSGFSGDVARK